MAARLCMFLSNRMVFSSIRSKWYFRPSHSIKTAFSKPWILSSISAILIADNCCSKLVRPEAEPTFFRCLSKGHISLRSQIEMWRFLPLKSFRNTRQSDTDTSTAVAANRSDRTVLCRTSGSGRKTGTAARGMADLINLNYLVSCFRS
jgi:hypothetical protein